MPLPIPLYNQQGRYRMKREFQLQLILFSVLLIGCEAPVAPPEACVLPGAQNQVSANENGNDGAETTQPRLCNIPEREMGADLTVNLEFRDFSMPKEAKLNDAIERMLLVINSKEFKQKVLAHEYLGKKTFVDNQNLTNQEVYEVIMAGVETLNGDLDQEMDLDLTLYYSNNSTVGYTYPNTNRVWINDKFFTTNSLGKVAGNIVHEWTHKLGFTHDFNRTEKRNYSVPYAVGNIIQELVDSL